MRSASGDRPRLPEEVLEGVLAHARRLGRAVASDDLFLLALAELPARSAAREALEAEGARAEDLLREIRREDDGPSREEGGLTFAPAYYSMEGRAEGFAAALADGRIRPEHVLMAAIWDPLSHSSQLLWRLGLSRERIVERLREHGVRVPPAPLPAQREIEWGERVWMDRKDVPVVLDHLRLHIPPGTQWGFNYEGERAWVHAEATVDLRALVEQASAR